jgi:hypothetical protein
MIASGQVQNVGRDEAAAEIKSSYELRGAIAAFELTTRRLLIANRDMHLAMDGKQVEAAVGRINTLTAEGHKQFTRSPSSARRRPGSSSTGYASSTAAIPPVSPRSARRRPR